MIADAMAVGGLALLGVGLAMVSVPLMLVVIGCVLFLAGLWSHLAHAAARRPVPSETDDPAAAAENDDGHPAR